MSLHTTSPLDKQNPADTWPLYSLSDLFIGELIDSGREELPSQSPGISTSVSRKIPSSGLLCQTQTDVHISDLGDVCCALSPSHIATTRTHDWNFSLPSTPRLVSRAPNVVELPNVSSVPENVQSITFYEVDGTSADAVLDPHPFQVGFSVAAINAREYVLPASLANHGTYPAPRISEPVSPIEEIPSTALQSISIAGYHSSEESATTATRSSPAHSETTGPNTIQCTWAACGKSFVTRGEYNHHSRNHTRPFQCISCPARHATKRQLDRHINEKHDTTEKYYCTVSTCKRSLVRQGKPFRRDDGCRKHMRRVHSMTGEQVKECDMDERTRTIRLARKVGRRIRD